MRFLKNVFSQLHTFVLWALMSAILWSWIFTMVTDTSPQKKVQIYIYVDELRDTDLAVYLEQDLPDGIKMVKVHPFTYAMLNVDLLENSDLFILPESMVGEYEELLLPGGEAVKVYDPDTGSGAAEDYISYSDEDYYLYFGAKSLHLDDGAAKYVADRLLTS